MRTSQLGLILALRTVAVVELVAAVAWAATGRPLLGSAILAAAAGFTEGIARTFRWALQRYGAEHPMFRPRWRR